MDSWEKRWNSHEREMQRHKTIFWSVFWVAAVIMVIWYAAVAVISIKTLSCVGDDKCLEAAGRNVGSFVKSVQDSASGK